MKTEIQNAIEILTNDPSTKLLDALVQAYKPDPSAFVPALAAILTHAGITPAALGPDMVEQLVAWSKATSRDDVIATMQRAAA